MWGIKSFEDYKKENPLNWWHSSRKIGGDPNAGKFPYFLSLDPTSLSFGNIRVDSDSAEEIITVTNDGYRPIEIKSIVVSGTFNIQHTAPAILEPGKAFDIRVKFSPKYVGESVGAIQITTNELVWNDYIKLVGIGTIFENLLLDGSWFLNGTYSLNGEKYYAEY